MDNAQRTIIRQNYRRLRDLISPSVDEVCHDLFSNKILSKGMKEDILSDRTSSRQASALLDKIPTRGPLAFGVFYQACIDNSLYGAADILKPENAPHEKIVDSEDTELQADETVDEPWSSEVYAEKVMSLHDEVVKVPNPKVLFDKHINNPDYYQMKSESRGLPFLIYDGDKPFSLDRQGLTKLFDNMNFDGMKVLPVKDVKKLEDAIKQESSREWDCFVLFIMSTSTDGFLRKDKSVTNLIDKVKSNPSLAKKPKLFFHIIRNTVDHQNEAAGGRLMDEDSRLQNQTDSVQKSTEDIMKDLKLKESKSRPEKQAEDRSINPSDETDGGEPDERIPTDSDIYRIKSIECGGDVLETGDGNRYTRFVHHLVFYFSKYAHKFEFYQLMKMMNNAVGPDKSMVRFSSDMSRTQLFFFPGCYTDVQKYS